MPDDDPVWPPKDSIEPPDPCEKCGPGNTSGWWWTDDGRAHCMKCDPPFVQLDWHKHGLRISPNRSGRLWYNELLKDSGLKYNPKTQRHERQA